MISTANIPSVGPAEPITTSETHRLMLAADRASARIGRWGQPREPPDPRPVVWWPEDFEGEVSDLRRRPRKT
jgi:hypothetical protein